MILAIDPGTTKTGWALMHKKTVIEHGVTDNDTLLSRIGEWPGVRLMAYEMVACYGMPVGREVFETVRWIGRFIERFGKEDTMEIFRKDVKLHLCGSPRAKDANIRQAILDLYEPSGGGSVPQVGTKKQPGPLYGVNSHIWPAIGVGLTYQGISA